MESIKRNSIGTTLVAIVSLLVLNLVLMAVFNFLTIDSYANVNSRVGALILSFSFPILLFTRQGICQIWNA